jgi:trans-2,3-dihydro-3-hydroxyanthranilate isomerase
MRYHFMIVDVFTDTPFGGNQLAVVTDASGLTDEAMQTIAREFDFPETTFLLPPADPGHTRRVRIFTPGRELPFAGHPTVGTACVLVMSGQCAAGELVLEEGVGPVPVSTRQDGASFSARLRLERAPDVPDRVSSPEDMAAVLSITPDDVVDVFCAGMGVNFTFVQVPSREIVDRSQLDHQAWARLLADQWGAQVYVFAGDLTDGAEIYARMYGPGLGITEDPATGAAAAAITGAAALRQPLPSGAIRLDIRQGVKMGRPSLIRTSATVEAGDLRSIEVGGGCVFVAEGQIEVPDDLMGRSHPVDL